MKVPAELSLAPFWGPRYWPMWVLLGFMRAVAKLSPSRQFRTGRWLARLLRRFKKREERVARRNIELCFGDLSAAEQAWQLPVHAVLQHLPSTHWPLVHCDAEVQSAPFD